MPLNKITKKLTSKLPTAPQGLGYYATIGDSEDGVLCLQISIGRADAHDSKTVSATFWDAIYLTVGITYELLPIIMALDDENFDEFTYSPKDTATGAPLLVMNAAQAREKAEESLNNVHDAFERFIAVYNVIS